MIMLQKNRKIKSIICIVKSVFILSLCVFWGCSQDGVGHSGKASNLDDRIISDFGRYSGKAMIGSSTGGAITVDMADGMSVMIDIPENALAYSKEVTLSVTEDEAGTENAPPTFIITIEPGVALLESAQLTVTFPENTDVSGRVLFTLIDDKIPLKQSADEDRLTASLYRLGTFSCSLSNVNDMVRAADMLISQDDNGVWQDAFTTFNGLVWLTDYFSATGDTNDAADCFSAIKDKSRQSAEAFITFTGNIEKGSLDYNALMKFRELMVLCENPENILEQIDLMISSSDS